MRNWHGVTSPVVREKNKQGPSTSLMNGRFRHFLQLSPSRKFKTLGEIFRPDFDGSDQLRPSCIIPGNKWVSHLTAMPGSPWSFQVERTELECSIHYSRRFNHKSSAWRGALHGKLIRITFPKTIFKLFVSFLQSPSALPGS